MKINWTIIVIVVSFAVILIAYLIIRNKKDEKNLEHYLNNQHNLEENEPELNEDDEH